MKDVLQSLTGLIPARVSPLGSAGLHSSGPVQRSGCAVRCAHYAMQGNTQRTAAGRGGAEPEATRDLLTVSDYTSSPHNPLPLYPLGAPQPRSLAGSINGHGMSADALRKAPRGRGARASKPAREAEFSSRNKSSLFHARETYNA